MNWVGWNQKHKLEQHPVNIKSSGYVHSGIVLIIIDNSLWDDIWSFKDVFLVLPCVEKLAEAQRRFATLQNELQSSLDAQRESNAPPGLRKRKTVFHLSQEERCKHHNIKDLKLAFSEFYLSLILLQNYQVSARTQACIPGHACSPNKKKKDRRAEFSN